VQEIIDSVQPQVAAYALEPMPWIFPDSAQSYRRLLETIDRPAFAVHYDPVNMVNSPARYFQNGDLIREFVAELGPMIRVVHVKDIALRDTLTVHLDEVTPGQGGLALAVLLREVAQLDADLPLMLEHLPDEASYDVATAHLRRLAHQEGVSL
jgi:sugar phosphate isomerase/epimerase